MSANELKLKGCREAFEAWHKEVYCDPKLFEPNTSYLCHTRWKAWQAAYKANDSALREIRAALEFYSDPINHARVHKIEDKPWKPIAASEVMIDAGKTAIQALTTLERLLEK